MIFTCLCSRAVHIETTVDLSTDLFLNALHRFQALRGPLRLLRSDQGTNFIGADNELRSAYEEMDHARIGNYLLQGNCDYVKFKKNPPSASHAGGVWERQIRTIRRVMDGLLNQFGRQLTDESLRTLLCEAACIINSRPLTVKNLSDVNSPLPLSPNSLLTQKTQLLLPPPGEFVREEFVPQEDLAPRPFHCQSVLAMLAKGILTVSSDSTEMAKHPNQPQSG